MGARYAPSVANLLMNMWEEEYLYARNIPHLKFYRRYIDDLIIIWEGTPEEFEEFLKNLNTNKYGLTFTGKWSHQKIDYLDLEIFKNGDRLYTKTYFKDTDKNVYIPITSCHHPQWKRNIPKGQLRLRRNCDTMEDFLVQADMLIEQFYEKGYNMERLAQVKADVINMDRKKLVKKKFK